MTPEERAEKITASWINPLVCYGTDLSACKTAIAAQIREAEKEARETHQLDCRIKEMLLDETYQKASASALEEAAKVAEKQRFVEVHDKAVAFLVAKAIRAIRGEGE